MSQITSEEWKTWKQDPVSRLFYTACIERIEESKEVLANTAGQDPGMDSFYRGFIYGYREMLEFRVEDSDDNDAETFIQ
jgi:hypothetical protein